MRCCSSTVQSLFHFEKVATTLVVPMENQPLSACSGRASPQGKAQPIRANLRQFTLGDTPYCHLRGVLDALFFLGGKLLVQQPLHLLLNVRFASASCAAPQAPSLPQTVALAGAARRSSSALAFSVCSVFQLLRQFVQAALSFGFVSLLPARCKRERSYAICSYMAYHAVQPRAGRACRCDERPSVLCARCAFTLAASSSCRCISASSPRPSSAARRVELISKGLNSVACCLAAACAPRPLVPNAEPMTTTAFPSQRPQSRAASAESWPQVSA